MTAVEISTIVERASMNDSKKPTVEDELVHVLFESSGKKIMLIKFINEERERSFTGGNCIILFNLLPLLNLFTLLFFRFMLYV